MARWDPAFGACLRECLGEHDWSWLAQQLWDHQFHPAVAPDATALARIFAHIGPNMECPFSAEDLADLDSACAQCQDIPDYARADVQLAATKQILLLLRTETRES